jgi:rare lipoprotein A (peptidoglycan hydrolase)
MFRLLKLILTFLIICSVSFSLLSCTSSKKFTSKKKHNSTDSTNHYGRYNNEEQNGEPENEIVIYRNPEILKVEFGIASYYANEFHKKETYNGEIYDMYGISAAHPSYPMGTIVKVMNLANNKSIELRINDRMPYREDRIIDLSYGAAEVLDMITSGITKVKVEVLKWGKGRK